jgi:hypothetical protein
MLLNKKLTIAVLTLGLLLTLGSAAFGSDAPKVRGVEELISTPKLNAPKASEIQFINAIQNMERPTPPKALATPLAVIPPDYFCDFYLYATSANYIWTLPDDTNPISEYGMRISPEEGYTCTLLTIAIAILPDAFVGTPGMKVTLRDASRNLLAEIDYTNAELPAIAPGYYGWLEADFSTANGGGPFTFYDGEEFFIGCQVIQTDPADTVALLTDNAAVPTDRNTLLIGTTWYSYTAGYNFLFGADMCCDKIPYTSCYRQEYDCGLGSVWASPDNYGDDYFNMLFDVEGPETLMAIGVAMYNNPGAGYPYEIAGTPDLDIFVWGDDGTGFPDLGNVIYTTTIPFANIEFYNQSGLYNVVDLSAENIVITSKFHVGWSTHDGVYPTAYLVGAADDATCGAGGRSSEYYGGVWGTMLADWGYDVNFLIYADLCRDEFANCEVWSQYATPALILSCPDSYCDRGFATKYSISGQGCRLEYFWIMYYWHPSHLVADGYDLYTTESELFAALPEAGTGYPDPTAKVLTKTLSTAADYGYNGTPENGGWWKMYDFTADNYRFDHDIWIGLENEQCDPLIGVELVKDDWDVYPLVDRTAELYVDAWEYIMEGWSGHFNVVWDAEVCCIPIPSRVCTDDEDWPTYGSSFEHDNASLNSVGDAQCNLTKAWMVQMDEAMTTASPVIYNDTVVGTWTDRIAAIDINSGSVLWETVRGTYGNLVIGSNLASTPTVMNMGAYGDSRTFVFIGGGNARAFAAFDLATGDTIWTRKVTVHGTNTFSLGICVVLPIDFGSGDVPVLYYASDDGNMFAVNALDGTNIWFPSDVAGSNYVYHGTGGGTQRGVGTNGSDLIFQGFHSTLTSSGDVVAINAADGSLAWSLIAVNGDVQGGTVVPAKDYPGIEGFIGGLCYEANTNGVGGTIYTASTYYPDDNSSPVQDGGVVYSIDGMTGTVNWVNVYLGGLESLNSGFSIDASYIIGQAWCPWTSSGQRRGPIAFAKGTGAEVWFNTTTNPGVYDADDGGATHNWHMDGMLSCETVAETELPDYYFAQCRENFLNVYDANTGEQLWHRRWSGIWDGLGIYNAGHDVSPVMDLGHVVVPWLSKLVCLVNGADRQRLSVDNYKVNVPVEFTTSTYEKVTFPEVYSNSGCAPLTINGVTIDEDDNFTVPDVATRMTDEERVDRLETKLNKIGDKAISLVDALSDIQEVASGSMRLSRKTASAAPPYFYVDMVHPLPGHTVAPGESDSITIGVNASIITRGAHIFYAFIDSDDPDYFLDSALMDDPVNYYIPAVELTIVGGCLNAQTTMHFGDVAGGEENSCLIFNSGRLADGDLTNVTIDGDGASFWQGALIYAMGPTSGVATDPSDDPGQGYARRVAFHSDNWQGEDWEFQSLLPDRSCVDPDLCEVDHQTNVLLGYYSSDEGQTYDEMYGEVLSFSYIDSVRNFWDSISQAAPGEWSWYYASDVGFDPPFDPALTMGFKACAKVFGVYDIPGLSNFMVHRHALFSRYGVPIEDIYVGAGMDFDVLPDNKENMMNYDAAHSLAVCYDCSGGDRGWGFIKLPFGPGLDPMLNCKTLSANQAMWNDSGIWLDSVYLWMQETGLSHQTGTTPCQADPDDRDAWMTLQKVDMNGTDSTILGFAFFGKIFTLGEDPSDVSNYFDMANEANMFCGWGRGDVQKDGAIDLVDILWLAYYVMDPGSNPGPYPYVYLGDVNIDGAVDDLDVNYLIDYYFNGGADPQGDWVL